MTRIIDASRPLVDVRGLATHFGGARKGLLRLLSRSVPVLRAVDGVDLTILPGQVVGLVGESGSGKTTLGRTILGLETPAAGEVLFEGRQIGTLASHELRQLRTKIQMIPQDAAASLSPRLSVSQLLMEVYEIKGTPRSARRSPAELLSMVELGPEHGTKYPHELSGGQARRVGIARAIAMEPEFIIGDEPTAGLDVSAVAAIVNLLARLRVELGLSYLLITHDLNVVAYLADVIGVMYLGKIVEIGPAEALIDAPRHPYTQSLLAAVSRPGEPRRPHIAIKGDLPSPRDLPSGCRFHTRCPFVQSICRTEEPQGDDCGDGHKVACHFWREISGTQPSTNPLVQ